MAQTIYEGIGVSEGIRIARAFVYLHPVIDTEKEIAPQAADAEAARFQAAVQTARAAVETLIARSAKLLGPDKAGVLKGQKGMLQDPAYAPEIEKLIRSRSFSAEKAVKQVTEQFATLFEGMPNPYLKERAADVRDAGARLLAILAGAQGNGLAEIAEETILIADDLSPSDTIQLDRRFVLGFATEKGGKTAHTSIFAKTMGLPAVVGVSGLLQAAKTGNPVILDGTQGICILSPDAETLSQYEARRAKEEERLALYRTFSQKQAALADGGRIVVAANVGSYKDAAFAAEAGAEAVGLMRTEQMYLSRKTGPTEDEQFEEYKKIAGAFSAAAPGDVIIRTLDIGGDKEVPYLDIPKEDNPFLGYRAIRLCLDRKDLFLTQLRALLRASAFGKLKIMLPMISGFDEVRQAKELLEQAKAELDARQIAYDKQVQVGIMVEIPAAALLADALAKEVDFFSIGTNDLVQYTLAADRGNKKVAYLYDYFHPAVLQLIARVGKAATENRIPAGMCGGMAGDPLAIPLLVGLGLSELSMAAGAVAQSKYILSRLARADCEQLAAQALACQTPKEARNAAAAFAQAHGLL